MVEVRLFATLRQGREKKYFFEADEVKTAAMAMEKLGIPTDEVAILLINGFHSKSTDEVKDGAVVSLFPPVAGG